jgi:GNAT superfamily N-acetyltransferase
MQIRDVNPDDALSVASLLTELDYPTTREEAERRIRAIDAYEDGRALVAVDDDGVAIGLVSAQVMHAVMTHDAPSGVITAMIVGSRARGGGVGRALVAAIESWLRDRGCEKVHVNAANRRSGAHAFYQRIGYEQTGKRFARAIR